VEAASPDITPLILCARQVNDNQPPPLSSVLSNGRLETGSMARKIAALGLAYKPDVDDLRESPAIETAVHLSQAGARVTAFEPFKIGAEFEGFETSSSLESAIHDADLILLLVSHTQFKMLDPKEVASKTKARLIVDTVNTLDETAWKQAGFKVTKLGVGSS